MKLGIRGIIDRDGDIHTWPTVAWQHREFFAVLPYLADDYRARFRQWDSEPGAKIDFDPGYERADAQGVGAFRTPSWPQRPRACCEGVLAFARKCGVR